MVTLTEHFNPQVLAYIIENFDSFNFRPETDPQETKALVQKYQAASTPDGTFKASYRQTPKGVGRHFAVRGLSLQTMAREIRNAIAREHYEDVDYSNCHPNLLRQRCMQIGVACPRLDEYCAGRDAIMQELSLPPAPAGSAGATPPAGSAKAAVLAVLNGGRSEPERRGVRDVPWLTEFELEMQQVRGALVGHADSPYLKLAMKSKRNAQYSGSHEGAAHPNLLGSAINMMLCDMENTALMALREYLEEHAGRRVGVLVFDGCMVERDAAKGPITAELLSAASDYVFAKTGYRLRLAVKDMTKDILNVPSSVYTGGPTRAPRYASEDIAAAAMFISDLSDSVWKCNGRVYVHDGPIWTSDEDTRDNFLLGRCMRANIVHLNAQGVPSPMSGNVPTAKRIIAAAGPLMPKDPDFEERMWQSVLGCMPYLNGVYDFRQRRFFPYAERPDVMPAMVIQRDFPAQRPPEHVFAELRQRVLVASLGDEEMAATYLRLIARATAGEPGDKQWMVMLGERNCGKGLLQELNEQAWGCYVNSVDANSFLLQHLASGDAAKAMSWALDCQYTRQTYTNEVKCDSTTRSIKLDGNMLKKFQSGGDRLSARKNNRDERMFRVATKLIMNMNDIPEVTPSDAMSTALLIKFPFKFVSAEEMEATPLPFFRVRDDTLKGSFVRRQDVIDAFTWMVIDAYTDGPVVPCRKVIDDSRSYMEDLGDDLTLMRENFLFTDDRTDFVTHAFLKSFLHGKNMSKTILGDRLVKMGAKRSKDCCVGGQKNGGGFTGVKYIGEDINGGVV